MKKILCLLFLFAVIGCREEAPSVAENKPNTLTNSPTASENTASQNDFPENVSFNGKIDERFLISMKLRRAGNSLAGTYQYVNKGQDLQVQGTLNGNEISLTEFDASGKSTGIFEGQFENGSFNGSWQTPDKSKKLPFSLTKSATTSNARTTIAASGIVRVIKKSLSKTGKNYKANVEYPELSGLTNQALQNQVNTAIRNFAQGEFNTFVKDAEENAAESAGEYELDMGFSEGIVNSKMANFLFSIYSYTGGAHPNTITRSQNYNLSTGRKLIFAEFMKPEYLNFLSDYSRNALKKEEGMEGAEDEWLKDGTAPKIENFDSFMLTKDGLHLHFDAYQVASYAAGAFDVVIPYNKMNELIKPNSVASGLK